MSEQNYKTFEVSSPPPFSSIGLFTYLRTYARRHVEDDPNSTVESWKECIERVVNACESQLKVGFSDEEQQELFDILYNLKGSVAGRFLWQLGTKTVDRLGLPSLQNCCVCVIDAPVRPFTWSMNMLMLGAGVGFRVLPEDVAKLPEVKHVNIRRDDTKDADFIVPDSREGWIKLLGKLLKAHFYSGKDFSYSCILLRSKGAPIKGFGGLASGPEVLCKGLNEINGVLNKRAGQKMRPIDALDVMNIIGMIVVSGNVRRCLPAGSLVHTSEGLIPIENMKESMQVLTSEGYHSVKNVFKQGVQKLVKIKTQDSYFRCTPNHRMAVYNSFNSYEWKCASELKKGDRLITSRNVTKGVFTELPSWSYVKQSSTCKDITIPTLDEKMAWFIGLFQGDGYTYPNYNHEVTGYNAYVSLVFGIDEYDIAERAKEQLQRFGENLNITLKKRKNENSYMVHCQSKQLAWYFDKNVKQAKKPIRVPDYILKASAPIRLAYVAGLVDSDGCVSNKPILVVTTVYKDFARDVQTLLYSCGIETRISEKKPKNANWQTKYNVGLITLHSQQEISKIPVLLKKVNVKSRSLRANSFPPDFVNDPSIKTQYGIYNKQNLNIDSYNKEYGFDFGCPTLVVSVEEDEETETYDIEVENKHEFFCNGYLTHNSALICQGDCRDVDYVMAKNWASGNIPNWRAFSNNSVICNDIRDIIDNEYFWKGYDGTGEPYGLINLNLSKKCGRLGDFQYTDPDVVGYNPCLSGDTKIAVADGRICVPIKQLAEEGKDVPVYSYNPETSKIEIKWGRNPRITGVNKKLIRVHFGWHHKGQYVDVTPNHKFLLNDGRIVEAKDLQHNDSIPMFKRSLNEKEGYVTIFQQDGTKETEHRMVKKFYEPEKFEQNRIDGVYNGACKTDNVVVHHKDEDKTNNSPDNLEIMSFNEHASQHSKEQCAGESNPMFGKKHRESTKILIGEKSKERFKDPAFAEKHKASYSKEIKEKLAEKMRKQKGEWDEKMAIEREKEAKESGFETVRIGNCIRIVKTCVNCKKEFNVAVSSSDSEYCSLSCANTKKESIESRRKTKRENHAKKSKEKFHILVNIYHELTEKNKNLSQKEFLNVCRQRKVPCRFQTNTPNPWIPKNWTDFIDRVKEYNHRVVKLEELNDLHTVYNLTVDDNHNFVVVTKEVDKNTTQGIVVKNCGEQSLSRFESCCLSDCYLPNIKSKEELFKVVTYLYKICKHSLTLPFHESPETEQIVHKNMRMGIGITGYLQASKEQRSWLSDCYTYLRQFDVEYSKKHGFPVSIKLTTTKPSGCVTEDTLIQTNEGLLRMDEIGMVDKDVTLFDNECNDYVYDPANWQDVYNLFVLDEHNELRRVNKFYNNGFVPTKKIVLSSGYEMEVSHRHKFMVKSNNEYLWKESTDLQIGDELKIVLGGQPIMKPRSLIKLDSTNKQPAFLDTHLASFIGMCYAYQFTETGLSIPISDSHTRNWFYNYMLNTFGLVDNVFLYEWLRTNGYRENAVPKKIRLSDRNVVRCFVTEVVAKPVRNTQLAQEVLALSRACELKFVMKDGIFTWARDLTEKVISITDSSSRTFDIEVDEVHHYRMGCVVSHNTLSLLGDCTAGVHPAFSRYYKRRIRIASESPLIRIAKEHGYHVEYVQNFDGTLDHTTQIVTFPKRVPDDCVIAEQCTAIMQLEFVKELQTNWSDNSVSVTVYYRKEELPEIKKWLLQNYNDNVKTVSFLLHSDHGFLQAPLEQITKEEYEAMMQNCKPIVNVEGICFVPEKEENLSQECVGGVCPIK